MLHGKRTWYLNQEIPRDLNLIPQLWVVKEGGKGGVQTSLILPAKPVSIGLTQAVTRAVSKV